MIYKIHRLLRLDGITSRFFLWAFVLVFLTSCLYVILFVFIDKKHQVDDAKDDLSYGLQQQKNLIVNWAEDRAEEVRLFASFPVTKETNIDVMATRFKYYHNHHRQLDSIVFINSDGHVVIDTAREDIILTNSTISLKDRHYFKAALAGEEYIYDIVTSKATGEQAIIFSSPVFSDTNQFQGVVFGAVHLNVINELLYETVKGDTAEVIFINSDGEIISQVTSKQNNSPQKSEVIAKQLKDVMKSSDNDLITYKDNNGDEMFAMVTELFDGRYYLVNQISKKEILAPHYKMVAFMIIIGFLIMSIGFVLVIPISRQLLKPFITLVQAIDRVKTGQYETQIDEQKFTTSPRELKQLMQSFNEMARSIHKNKRVLKQLSNTDGLTGIANRRRFEERLAKEWQIAKKGSEPISLIFADVDYFKKYNDQFGHLMGDSCLIQLAHAMKSLIENPNYLVARYGGEEFVIVMPATTSDEATVIAEEVRQQVKDLQIRRSKENKNQYITISLGVATITPTETLTKEDLIQLADQALYEAKSSGRNQVVVKNTL